MAGTIVCAYRAWLRQYYANRAWEESDAPCQGPPPSRG